MTSSARSGPGWRAPSWADVATCRTCKWKLCESASPADRARTAASLPLQAALQADDAAAEEVAARAAAEAVAGTSCGSLATEVAQCEEKLATQARFRRRRRSPAAPPDSPCAPALNAIRACPPLPCPGERAGGDGDERQHHDSRRGVQLQVLRGASADPLSRVAPLPCACMLPELRLRPAGLRRFSQGELNRMDMSTLPHVHSPENAVRDVARALA